MCGICGIASLAADPGGPPRPRVERVDAMMENLLHRGPDASATAVSTFATFGAHRLAIRGLADGHQPLEDSATGVIAVCNGEIDNHNELRAWLRERGRPVTMTSDVGVVVPLYLELGAAFVERLEGAFAVALWDPRRRILLLSRDRAGERPLFYLRRDGEVVFATEISALAAAAPNLRIAREPVAEFVRQGCMAAPTTPFTDVAKVRPGETVVFAKADADPLRYWTWPIGDAPQRSPSLPEFDRIFRAAVATQSAADVDFGLLLSGGVDSSLIAAVTRSLYPDRPLLGFTVRMIEPSYDEGDFAREVAERFNIRLVDVPFRADDVPELIARLVRLSGEPLGDPAWLPTALLARAAAGEGLRLALTGEGADELFGGYPAYLGAGLGEAYARLPQWCRAGVRRVVDALPPSERKVTVGFLLKRFVSGDGAAGLERHRRWTAAISDSALTALGLGVPATVPDSGGHPLDVAQRYDFETTLGEGLLTKSDRGGMSETVEIRAPFLNRAVMEFAARLPYGKRVRGLRTKRFLKDYARTYLPGRIVDRRKRGLSVPLASWLRGTLHPWAESRLAGARLTEAGIDGRAALALLEAHRRSRADHSRGVWNLLVLDVWLEWNADRAAAVSTAAAAGRAGSAGRPPGKAASLA